MRKSIKEKIKCFETLFQLIIKVMLILINKIDVNLIHNRYYNLKLISKLCYIYLPILYMKTYSKLPLQCQR